MPGKPTATVSSKTPSVTVFGDVHITGTLTAEGKLQIAQSTMTGNVRDTAPIGIDTVIRLLHRRIDDLEARVAGFAAS